MWSHMGCSDSGMVSLQDGTYFMRFLIQIKIINLDFDIAVL